ncbi:MAG: hypothetical protein QOI27_2907 [Gaiellaceae bacterium]|jgi:hypothetical protein|nr:hypothetical protein [Gaiellaceae bacterium]MDX6468565.1 hypothetical protein [Gaiellaceae bacterium]MDX6472165.1 hypothetical protein [Gaiellaceae bacterium]
MSLRGTPVEEDATLPDGRVVHIRIGVPQDSYVPARELHTVTIELSDDDEHLAAINTVLEVDQGSEALALAREIVAGLEAGTLQPTAGALEPLADTLR